jgi:hypothetical protein
MNSTEAKLWTLRNMRDLVAANIDKVGGEHNEHDSGQLDAYNKVLTDIRVFESIIDHSISHSGQQDPGMDY